MEVPMKSLLKQLFRDTEGQDLIEYTLLMAFVVATVALLANGFSASILGINTANNNNLAAANRVIR
jgi:Flp pilus assembly pilin Flp